MIAPVDFTGIEVALASRASWIELAIIAACFTVGWILDRRWRLESASEAEVVRLGLGSVNRLLLPLVTLVLMVVADALFRRWHPPFFLPIAIPLMVALALIRLLVYAMREIFGAPKWLPSSERVDLVHDLGHRPPPFHRRAAGAPGALDATAIPVGSKQVSVFELLKGTVVLVLTLSGCLWLSGVVEQRLQKAANLDSSVRVVISKFIRALLLTVGVLVALHAVGIDLTLLAVFGGALGVGIGLGLQKLASNYIAGFTILLDRSIRLGDRITVDKYSGIVASLTSRYVIVRSPDGVEAVVPNETLVTTIVLNHSRAKRETRVGLPVQVAARHRHRSGAAADGGGGPGRAARAEERAERAGGARGPFRRERDRSRARGLDRRSRQRPARPAQQAQPGDLARLSRERHQAFRSAARPAHRGAAGWAGAAAREPRPRRPSADASSP